MNLSKSLIYQPLPPPLSHSTNIILTNPVSVSSYLLNYTFNHDSLENYSNINRNSSSIKRSNKKESYSRYIMYPPPSFSTTDSSHSTHSASACSQIDDLDTDVSPTSHFISHLKHNLNIDSKTINTINTVYRKAVDGHTDSMYVIGYFCINYISPPMYEDSIRWLTMAADNNNSDAMFELGKIYMMDMPNLPFSNDIEKAIHYLDLAVKNNHVASSLLLGYIYSTNKKLKNNKKAFKYYKIAASLKAPSAFVYLSKFYESGVVVNKDKKFAEMLKSMSNNIKK